MMRRSLSAVFLFVALVATPTLADEEFDPAALPHDRAALSEVNDRQLRLLNKAVRACGDIAAARHNGNVCVISALDLDIRQSGDEALKAFHWSLMPFARYNDKRTMVDVSRLMDVKN
jgi:hypothetical protein